MPTSSLPVDHPPPLRSAVRLAAPLLLLALLLGACARPTSTAWQGYLEGDFLNIAAPLAGRLDHLDVARGDHVEAGARLYALDAASEIATRDEAAGRLAQARARLADLQKGSRPDELAALDARLQQARSAADLSALDLQRFDRLYAAKVVSASDHDRARLTHERNRHAIEELQAQLATARLGARSDALAAAEADIAASSAALSRAEWTVQQKAPPAPRAALVYDTLFRAGEFVPAGQPVVTLLPPENLKARFYVPEADLPRLTAGGTVRVAFTGRPPVDARIAYVSPKAEYTPPVLYNRDNRAKLLFLVEAILPPAAAATLHPGQPVDVTLP